MPIPCFIFGFGKCPSLALFFVSLFGEGFNSFGNGNAWVVIQPL